MRGVLPVSVLAKLAVRNVGRNRARSVLSLAAIAVGVAGLILSGGFVHDLIYQLGEALIRSQSGHVQVAREGYFEAGSRSPAKYLMGPQDFERVGLSSLPHVAAAMRRVAFSGLASNGRSSYPIVGEGIEAEPESKLGSYLTLLEGRMLAASDTYAVLVGEGVARTLGLRLGQTISLVAPTVDGAMNTVDLEVVGVFQTFSKDYDDRALRIPLSAAQSLLDTQGFNTLVLLLDETRWTGSVAKRVGERIAGSGLEMKTWDWLNDFYWKAVALYDRQFGVLRLIVLAMVLLAIAGAVNMAVLERAGEFGTMRALGNRGMDVFRLVIAEGLVLGVLGAFLGVLFGTLLGAAVSGIGIPMPPPPNSNLEFTARIQLVPSLIGGAAAIGVAATTLASVAPAVRVARLSVVEALRRMV